MKHTPGPWKHYQRSSPDPDELHRFFIAQPEGNNHIIANTVKEYASIDDEANACLIAAAPDLLDALERLFEHTAMVHNRWGENSNTEEADLAIQDARAAIAKARG